MQGYKSYNGMCGATDSLTVPSGQLSNRGRMRWRYIEDFIGNGYEFFDGAYGLGATQDESKYGQTVTDVEYSAYGGYCLSALKVSETYPLLAVPGGYVSNDNYNTYFCAYVNSASGDYVYLRGCDDSNTGALFRWGRCGASNTIVTISSRLLLTL